MAEKQPLVGGNGGVACYSRQSSQQRPSYLAAAAGAVTPQAAAGAAAAAEELSLSAAHHTTVGRALLVLCTMYGLISLALATKAIPIMPSVGFLDTFYFAVVTMTTVGYGDISPTTPGARLFVCLYTFTGLVLLAVMSAYHNARHMARMDHVRRKRRGQGVGATGLFHTAADLSGGGGVSGGGRGPGLARRANTRDPGGGGLAGRLGVWHWLQKGLERSPWGMRVAVAALPLLLFMIASSVAFGVAEGWTLTDAAYFTFTTGSTIGFGDLSPTKPSSKLFCIAFIPLCVFVIKRFMGTISYIFIQIEVQRLQDQILGEELTLQDLLEIDTNRDGKVDELEFMTHMLKKMNKVDDELLARIHAQFVRADADGNGVLDEEDVRMLRRQTASVRESVLRRSSSLFHPK